MGLAIVLALHATVLWGLWNHRLIPTPQEAMTVFVDFLTAPARKAEDPPKLPPKPRPLERPQPRQLVAETPLVAPTDYVAPAPLLKPAPVIEAPGPALGIAAPPTPAPIPVGPVTLTSELSVACPERKAPSYPLFSQRFNEQGTVTLRVELDENGHVAAARVNSSSGFARLDEAALAAVRTWRCTPASRNGAPVRAVALQPFKFVLQGN